MTTMAVPTAVAQGPSGSRLRWTLGDAATLTWRNLKGLTRIPDAIFFATLQPIMFVLLFRFVFGGAISIPGVSYVDYLMPGIFVQTVAFGAVSTAVGLADDLQKGLIERFRALPMARSAVLAGRTTADLIRNIFIVTLITVDYFLCGALIVLFFAYAVGWGFAAVGLTASNPETAQLMAFPILFPLTFASSAFVPVSTMPGWLQAFAKHQPVTQVVDAARSLMVGGVTHDTASIYQALAWCAGLLIVLVPLAVSKFRQVS